MHRALQIAERQHGVVHRAQLVAAGLTPLEIRQLTRSTGWERLGRHTFRRTGSRRSHLQAAITAVLRSGADGALYGTTAAWLWLFENTAPRPPLHVVQPVSRSTTPLDGVRLHRVTDLPERWVVRHRDVPVCRPALVAVQIFATRRYESAERQVDRLWSNRLLSGSSIVRCLDEFGASGRNGITALRQYLDHRGTDWIPPASGLESRVIQIMRAAGIATRRQVDVGSEDEWTGRVDLVCEETNVIIEVQSELHHASLTDRRSDDKRIAQLQADGFVVVEITDAEAFHTPNVAVRRVQEALRSSGVRRR